MNPVPVRMVRAGLAVTAALLAVPAAAQFVRPVPRPMEIKRSGSYILSRDLTLRQEGTAILITADNVSLDLNGHSLIGPGGQLGVGVSIRGARGVRVFGGTVNRFGIGIEVVDAANVRVEGVHVHGEDSGGPPPGEVGVLIVNSRGVVVERNVVTGTFLGVFVRGGGSGGNRIAENTLTGGSAGQLGICYNPDGLGSTTGPSGDLVESNLVSRFVLGIQTSADTSGNVFRENSIAYFTQAIQEVGAGQNVFEDNAQTAVTP